MELYIHIPFCKKKCDYCDFISFACQEKKINPYIDAISKEIDLSKDKFKDRVIDTIYVGGGTPSILSEMQLAKIIQKVKNSFKISPNVEFTIECNPESLTKEKLIFYKLLGVNRLSIGVQSLNDENLTAIGRIHNRETAIEKVKLASEYFENLSCDLIIGLPYDSKDSIKEEIDILSPYLSHISMYELILEDGTKLKENVDNKLVEIPSDDDTQDLFEYAYSIAKEKGFVRYEISNFAKNNRISLHNYGYWIREEYLGLGLNSASLIKEDGKETRYTTISSLDEYIENMKEASSFDDIKRVEKQDLSIEDVLYEIVMLGLRTTRGVKKEILAGVIPEHLEKYFKENGQFVGLTDEGMAIMNTILLEIL